MGMGKAKAMGKAVGRPDVVDNIDAELVLSLRIQSKSWSEIAEAHHPVKTASGRKVHSSAGPIEGNRPYGFRKSREGRAGFPQTLAESAVPGIRVWISATLRL